MTENDANNTPKENPVNADDDLENLSLDEKAAFEKIMAEIGNMNKDDEESTPTVSSAPAEATGSQVQPSDDTPKVPDEQIPPEDQQAALDKIMAEINASDEGGETGPEESPQPVENDDESLSEDQQAALDKIMAEINARSEGGETEPEESPQPAEGDDESLSEDQQAALDKIMAEISARSEGGETEPEEIPQPAEDDASLSEDQQPALEDISAKPEKNEAGRISNENPKSQPDKLTLDEFNDELDNLLSNEQLSNPETPAPKALSKKSEPAQKIEEEHTEVGLPSEKTQPATASPGDTALQDGEIEQDRQAPAHAENPRHPGGAILVEVDSDQGITQASKKNSENRNPKSSKRPKLIKISVAALVSIVLACSGFWGYRTFIRSKTGIAGLAEPINTGAAPPTAATVAISEGSQTFEKDTRAPMSTQISGIQETSSVNGFGSLRENLIAARRQVSQKIDEIVNLRSYYQKGIHEETAKIKSELPSGSLPSLEKALSDSQIELSLQAIQRRTLYIEELENPLKRLEESSEDLLYLERRTRLFETLSEWISTPSLPEYKLEISGKIQNHLKIAAGLSVNQSQKDPPPISAVWKDVLAEIQNENKVADRRPVNNDQDRKISREICDGDYSRKYLLTSLTVETVQCLVKWSGKDLYLNDLTELPPDLAKILIQWPGEWLSLNGIKKMSVETASYLSQWPGKRLSLNGLKDLSPAVTAQLSKWRGQQLEMIGLTSIGRWENYTTRLYLSESLRRKLQM